MLQLDSGRATPNIYYRPTAKMCGMTYLLTRQKAWKGTHPLVCVVSDRFRVVTSTSLAH